MNSKRNLVWRLILLVFMGAAISWPGYAQQVNTKAGVRLAANQDKEYQRITKVSAKAVSVALAQMLAAAPRPAQRTKEGPGRIGDGQPGSSSAAGPDLLPVSDGGRFLEFQRRQEWRYAFWARNSGNAPAPPSRIRLKFYQRPGMARDKDPWKMHADVYLDIPVLNVGAESRALVGRIVYRKHSSPFAVEPFPQQYKFEFFVDALNRVPEANEENNTYVKETMHAKHDVLETGPSGRLH